MEQVASLWQAVDSGARACDSDDDDAERVDLIKGNCVAVVDINGAMDR